jgi:general secretion pathway protein G
MRAKPGKGFTLIELLVVMSILGLLIAIAAPRYMGRIEKSKESVLKHNLAAMRNALDQYHDDAGRFPNSLDALAKGRYLREIPVDPMTERSDTWVVSLSTSSEAPGIQDVRSGAEGKALDGTDYGSW